MILLPETFSDGAEALARRLMDAIIQCGVATQEHPMGVLTASAAIHCRAEWIGEESWQDLVEAADESLHQVMKLGHNQIAVGHPIKPLGSETVEYQGLTPRQ